MERGDESLSLDSSDVHPGTVFLPDDRRRVTPTTSYPWSAVVAVYFQKAGLTPLACSGVLVDKFHVLTAAHCLYLWDPRFHGWADSVWVVPAMDNGSQPYGTALATVLRVPPPWMEAIDFRYDLGLITLDRNVGSFTGWMNATTADPADLLYTGLLQTAGYPFDLDDGRNMYFTSAEGCWADEYFHGFWLDVAGGQSGSPVWAERESNYYVLSIVSHDSEEPNGCNVGTRLGREALDMLSNWTSSDLPPVDRPDLRDAGREYASFSPDLAAPGRTYLTLAGRVWNGGTAPSNGFDVSYYVVPYSIWEEPSIDAEAILIGKTDVPPLEPFESRDILWTGVLPPGVPSGEYWLGWLIDSGGAVAEFNEGDNEVFIWGRQLGVDASPPQTVANVSGLAGTEGWYRSAVQVALHGSDDFSGVNGTMYRIDSGVWAPYLGPFHVSIEGRHVLSYYSVDRAGNTEDPGHFSFGIDMGPPQNLTITYPAEQEVVHTGLVEVRYHGVDLLSGIDRYLVQIDDGPAVSAGVELSFSFSGVADGPHIVRVTAVDKAGNEASVTRSFRVDTNIFSLSGPYGPAPIVGLLAAPAGGVVLAIVLRSRRRKKVA